MVVHSFIPPSPPPTLRQEDLRVQVQDQPGIQNKFPDSQSYTLKPGLEKLKPKPKPTPPPKKKLASKWWALEKVWTRFEATDISDQNIKHDRDELQMSI